MKKLPKKMFVLSLTSILGVMIVLNMRDINLSEPLIETAQAQSVNQEKNFQVVQAKSSQSQIAQELNVAPFSAKELEVINQWANNRKWGGGYIIDSSRQVIFQEDALLTKYREMNVDELRDIVKKNRSYQAERALVEKLLEQNSLKFDSQNSKVVAEVTALVLDLALQGEVNTMQRLVSTYMANGYKVAERNGKNFWLTDQESYKNAIKYSYVLEQRGHLGFSRYKQIIVTGNTVFSNLPEYNKIIEQGRAEGEQLYQQLEFARQQKGLPPFDNSTPNEVNKLYDYLTTPLREMEQQLR